MTVVFIDRAAKNSEDRNVHVCLSLRGWGLFFVLFLCLLFFVGFFFCFCLTFDWCLRLLKKGRVGRVSVTG